jgi:hypothetical protein
VTDPSTADLAAFYGLTRKSVLKILRTAGVKPIGDGHARQRMRWPREASREVLARRARAVRRHADAHDR